MKKKKVKRKIKFKKIFKKTNFYLGIIQIILSIILLFTIINIKILSLKYIIPIILIITIINFLSILFLSKSKKKKTKIISKTISLLLSIIFLISTIIINQVYLSMNNMFKNDSYIDYSVLVLKNSKYQKINNLDNKIIGFYIDDKYNESAKNSLDKKIATEYIGYSSINELKNALISQEIDGMLIMDSYLEIDDIETQEVKEENNDNQISESDQLLLNSIKDFDTKSKVIYNFKIKVDNSKKSKKIDLDKGSFAIYISGQDSFDTKVSETSRSDVNLLMIVNLKSKQILIISIPRDYYINISSKKALDKLTHISLYGSDETMKSLGELLDVNIDYFVKFNFTTFMKAIEYMLPLDVYSDYDFTTSIYDQTIGNSYTFKKGYNHITNGKMALQFVRARKNFAEGDRQRGINQSRFLRAVINKASSPSILLKYNKILKALEGTFLSNISNESIQEIVNYVLNNNGSFDIHSFYLDGSDANRPTYSGGRQPLYVMIPNQQSIENTKVLINDVLNGKIPEIEQDASELADIKNSHIVTEDIGKINDYTPNYNYSSNFNNKNNNITENNKVPDIENNEDNNNQLDEENNNESNTEDKEEDKPVEPVKPPTESITPPITENEENNN